MSVLPPVGRVIDERLGALARPTRGRQASPRFAFAVCRAGLLDRAEPHVAEILARWTGPTRVGAVAVESYTRAQADRVLEGLTGHGQSADTVLRLAGAVTELEDTYPGEARLVVAVCRVLWDQTARTVALS